MVELAVLVLLVTAVLQHIGGHGAESSHHALQELDHNQPHCARAVPWVMCCALLYAVLCFAMHPGLVCFDLDNFLEMTQKSGKWQCPGTRSFHSWKQLRVCGGNVLLWRHAQLSCFLCGTCC